MNRRIRGEIGQSLLEYTLVLPVFVVLVLGVIEFGLLYFQYNSVTNAAREGARTGIVMATAACPLSCLEDEVEAAALAIAVGLDPDFVDVDVDWPESTNGIPQVSVRVAYRTSYITRMLIEAAGGNGEITLESTATMQREY